MNLRGGASKGSPFVASNLLLPHVPPIKEPLAIVALRVPGFLPARSFYRFGWVELLGTALSRYPDHLINVSATLFRQIPVCPRRFAVNALAASLFLHFSGYVWFSPFFSSFSAAAPSESVVISDHNNIVYYHFAKPEHRSQIPRILPPGPGSMPGAGSDPERAPAKGATKVIGNLFAVSHPRLPDNSHQTILQPNSPSELRSKADLKLPNIVMAMPSAPKAPLQFTLKKVHPVLPAKQQFSENAPSLSEFDTAKPVTGLLASSISNRHPAVPIGAAPAPLRPSHHGEMLADTTAPQIEASGANGEGLVILGTDPVSPAESLGLPKGNRYGEFSIAPSGNGYGSPGGRGGSVPSGGGNSGDDAGGNGSTGTGRGAYGGGGGNSGSPGIISLRGGESIDGRLGDPGPDLVASMVFPLPSPIGVRHNALVVSAGPMGGGGLDIYGVLPCTKVYSIVLFASGKTWSLQYCQKSEPLPQSGNITRSPIVHTDLPLVPPEAEEQFDFKRVPLPQEKTHKMIVLRGEIGEDGRVENLKVFRGLSPEMDAAACLAFSRWKFKPAMRSGKPVILQILLGIPAEGGKVPPAI